jgi:glycosyltransferase involved in cell wall biosynthesis
MQTLITNHLELYSDQMRAPVLVFAYNRPKHLLACLNSIETNIDYRMHEIRVIVDGPRDTLDETEVENTLKVASGHKIVSSIQHRPNNLGLANSIIRGVSETLVSDNSVIVIEDDLVVHSQFLHFMNMGLEVYAGNPLVATIQGFTPGLPVRLRNPFFIRGADCWGWATWKDRWKDFETNPEILLASISKQGLRRKFDYYGLYPYTNLLYKNVIGQNNSWAIRWHATNFLLKRVSLHPPHSLIVNRGTDGSGTHMKSESNSLLKHDLFLGQIDEWKLPQVAKEKWFFKLCYTYPFLNSFLRRIRFHLYLALKIRLRFFNKFRFFSRKERQ